MKVSYCAEFCTDLIGNDVSLVRWNFVCIVCVILNYFKCEIFFIFLCLVGLFSPKASLYVSYCWLPESIPCVICMCMSDPGC